MAFLLGGRLDEVAQVADVKRLLKNIAHLAQQLEERTLEARDGLGEGEKAPQGQDAIGGLIEQDDQRQKRRANTAQPPAEHIVLLAQSQPQALLPERLRHLLPEAGEEIAQSVEPDFFGRVAVGHQLDQVLGAALLGRLLVKERVHFAAPPNLGVENRGRAQEEHHWDGPMPGCKQRDEGTQNDKPFERGCGVAEDAVRAEVRGLPRPLQAVEKFSAFKCVQPHTGRLAEDPLLQLPTGLLPHDGGRVSPHRSQSGLQHPQARQAG